MKLCQLREEIDGLPTSHNPYAPSVRDADQTNKKDIKSPEDDLEDKEDFELPKEGKEDDLELPEDDLEGKEDDLEDKDLSDEDLDDDLPEELTDLEPEQAVWEPYEVPNKRDMSFRRTDGFMLRARRLDAVPNKYIAQIWIDDKVLDRGMLYIPDDVDPELYLQEMANYMLDTGSNRYQQIGKPEPGEEMEPDSIGPIPEELEEPGTGEEIGLDEDNFDFD